MIHYHVTPITPRSRLLEMAGSSFCVSFADRRDVEVCHEIGQSVMLDNGAYSHWKEGKGTIDLDAYARWVEPWLDYRTTWCVVPDVIDGDEGENDLLLSLWFTRGLPFEQCAPVWHLHESLDRLARLCAGYPRVCLGSSGQFARIGDERWNRRLCEAFNRICGDGPPPTWLHMLRGLTVASEYPFASADGIGSLGKNWNRGNGRRLDSATEARRIDSQQGLARWRVVALPRELEVMP